MPQKSFKSSVSINSTPYAQCPCSALVCATTRAEPRTPRCLSRSVEPIDRSRSNRSIAPFRFRLVAVAISLKAPLGSSPETSSETDNAIRLVRRRPKSGGLTLGKSGALVGMFVKEGLSIISCDDSQEYVGQRAGAIRFSYHPRGYLWPLPLRCVFRIRS